LPAPRDERRRLRTKGKAHVNAVSLHDERPPDSPPAVDQPVFWLWPTKIWVMRCSDANARWPRRVLP